MMIETNECIGKMRGVGWAICYENPANGRLSNHWITLHETGNVAGFNPVLVMDVWEHAFLLDYKPAERPKCMLRGLVGPRGIQISLFAKIATASRRSVGSVRDFNAS